MSAARHVLVLRAATSRPEDIAILVESLRAQGAAVVVRDARGDYDALLDDIAAADAVICWR